jgi:hypothetical protein
MLRPLTALSDDELHDGVCVVTSDARVLLARQIAFLAEVERRRLWSDLACTSLHDFCQRRLRMSDYGAYRRVAAARLALRFPIILEKVQDGEIHLSALLQLRKYMTSDNHVELLAAACNKSARAIDEMLAARFPRVDVSSRVWEAKGLPGDRLSPSGLDSSALPSGKEQPACDERIAMEALSPGRHRFEFTGSSELRDKVEYARSLMRHSNPKGDLGVIVERGMDLLIAELEKKQFGKTTRPRKTAAEPDTSDERANVDKTLAIGGAEHIQAHVRREVAERDDYRCTFVSADGQCCGSQSFLQFDHIVPKARRGPSTAANLRLRCKAHNTLAAEKIFGRDFIEKKIAEKRQRTTAANRANGHHSSPPCPKQIAAKRRDNDSPPPS